MQVKYLNTDFEIESSEDVSKIVEEFGGDAQVLFHGKIKGYYRASFEVSPVFIGADEAVNYFCTLVEQLPENVRKIWNACVSKVVDLGYESGESPSTYRSEIRSSTVRRIADIGASIIITIYPINKDENDDPHS